jgi:hypothetical protein
MSAISTAHPHVSSRPLHQQCRVLQTTHNFYSKAKDFCGTFYFLFSSNPLFVTIIIIPLLAVKTTITNYHIYCLSEGGLFLKYFSLYEFVLLPDDGRVTRSKHIATNAMNR